MRVFRLVPLALTVLLTGCFGGDVARVKDSKLKGWPQFKIGQLLDKRQACSSIKWEAFTDDRDRKIVQYTCENKLVLAHISGLHEKDVESQERSKQLLIENAAASLEHAERALESTVSNLAKQRELVAALESGEGGLTSQKLRYEQEYLSALEGDVPKRTASLEAAKVKVAQTPSSPEFARIDEQTEGLNRKRISFQRANEVSQWTVQDGEALYLGSKLELVFADGTIEERLKPEYVFDHAAKNASTVDDLHGFYLMQITTLWRHGRPKS